MDATTTTRPTSGRTILAALALALLAALLVSQAAGAVGATTATINKRIGAHKATCDSDGGTFEYTYNYDKNGNVTTVVTTCDLGAYGQISCDVSTRSSDCVPALTVEPSSPYDSTVMSGSGEASTVGSGGSAVNAGTHVAPGGGQVVLATDDDRP